MTSPKLIADTLRFLVVATLTVHHIWLGLHASAHVDSARDFAFALDIALREQFHATGPEIGSIFHLGPIWYYILSLPLALGLGFTGICAWVAIISSTQYYLAYALGNQVLGSKDGGVLCAVSLALPSWGFLHFTGFTHTVLLTPTLLLAFLMIWRYWSVGSASNGFMAGLSIALAMHGHPTAIVCVPILFFRIWKGRSGRELIAVCCGLVVLFLPYIGQLMLAPVKSDATRTTSYFRSLPFFDLSKNLPHSFLGAIWGGVSTPLEMISSAQKILQNTIKFSWTILVLLALAGLTVSKKTIAFDRYKGWLLLLAAIALSNVIVACLIRPFVTFYMLGVLTVSLPLIVSIGWFALRSRWPQTYPIVVFVAMSAYIGFGFTFATLIKNERLLTTPLHFIDVKTIFMPQVLAQPQRLSPFVPMVKFDAFAKYACIGGSSAVHGPAILISDMMGHVMQRLHCPEGQIVSGGNESGMRHIVGLSCGLFRGDGPKLGSICFGKPSRIYSRLVTAIPDSRVYPPRTRSTSQGKKAVFDITLGANELLVLTNPIHAWESMAWSLASVDAELVEVEQTPYHKIFSCANCKTAAREVRVEVTAGFPGIADVVVVPRKGLT
jgi:hypothetical protein